MFELFPNHDISLIKKYNTFSHFYLEVNETKTYTELPTRISTLKAIVSINDSNSNLYYKLIIPSKYLV